jgi:hypothetical protein
MSCSENERLKPEIKIMGKYLKEIRGSDKKKLYSRRN